MTLLTHLNVMTQSDSGCTAFDTDSGLNMMLLAIGRNCSASLHMSTQHTVTTSPTVRLTSQPSNGTTAKSGMARDVSVRILPAGSQNDQRRMKWRTQVNQF